MSPARPHDSPADHDHRPDPLDNPPSFIERAASDRWASHPGHSLRLGCVPDRAWSGLREPGDGRARRHVGVPALGSAWAP